MRQLFFSLMAVTLLFNGIQPNAEPGVEQNVKKKDIEGIKNYSRIEHSRGFAGAPVGFGGATMPNAAASLKSEGFASIINLRRADEDGVDIAASEEAASAAGIHYLHIPLDPTTLSSTEMNQVLDALANTGNQPVYLHCNSATRAGMVWMVGRVLRDNWSPDMAGMEIQVIAGNPDDAIAAATAYLEDR